MMAVCGCAGALLLVMLIGSSYSYRLQPMDKGLDSTSSNGGSYGTKPAPGGSTWEVPSSGEFAPAASGYGAASKPVSNPARPQIAPRREPSYPQPSAQWEPAAASGYVSSSSAGSTNPDSFQPTSFQDFSWAVAPPGPQPSARQFASSRAAGPSNVSPPGPAFQAGELSKFENRYEHGNYESETEEQGFQQPPPGADIFNGEDSTSELQPAGSVRGFPGYPYDYMFLTGQYPPGTVTHYSSSFEHGADHWQDSHYIRDYFPANPSTGQVETFPADFQAPQSIQQPGQPVKQSVGQSKVGY